MDFAPKQVEHLSDFEGHTPLLYYPLEQLHRSDTFRQVVKLQMTTIEAYLLVKNIS